jgi:hypothetical protein
MVTKTKKRPQPKTEKTKVPGVYRRGNAYIYSFRLEGRQRWGRAATLDEARRAKRQAEADADRGELVDLTRVRFADNARDWVAHDPGRTSRGFRESTRASDRQMLDDRVIPYFDGVRRLRLAEIQPRDVPATALSRGSRSVLTDGRLGEQPAGARVALLDERAHERLRPSRRAGRQRERARGDRREARADHRRAQARPCRAPYPPAAAPRDARAPRAAHR